MQHTSTMLGYTLLELLVVVAIIGLIAVFATPAAQQAVQAASMRADVRTLVSTLRQAQRDALERQTTITVCPAAQGSPQKALAQDDVVFISLPGVQQIPNAKPISYYPDGTSSGGALRLDEGRQAKLITIAWLTGTISIGDAR